MTSAGAHDGTSAGGGETRRGSVARGGLAAGVVRALVVMIGVLVVIWALQIVNWLDHYWLSRHFGIIAHRRSRLADIFAAPFLHWSFAHIEANSVPLFFLGFLAAYRGIRKFVVVSLVIIVTSGLGSWLFASTHTVDAGASGVVFGYFGYVVVRGIIERHLLDVLVGVVVVALYWSMLSGVLPSDPHIGWQAHLFGLVGGVGAALMLRVSSRRPTSAGTRVIDGARVASSSDAGSRGALHQELDDLGL